MITTLDVERALERRKIKTFRFPPETTRFAAVLESSGVQRLRNMLNAVHIARIIVGRKEITLQRHPK